MSAEDALRARGAELANQLRTAAIRGDKPRITRVLAELVRLKGARPGRQVAVQALTEVIDSLRSVAITDELTSVYNRRGFIEIGTRFLDVARRDLQCAYLVYLDVNNLKHINDTAGHSAGDVIIQRVGRFLRELFPSYGVHEVLGRLGGDEFAALTTDMKCPSRSEILLRARMTRACSFDSSPLSLSVGLAYFNPLLPIGIHELLENAEHAMYEHKRVTRLASSGGSSGRA